MWIWFGYGNIEYYHVGVNYAYITDVQLSSVKLEMSQKYAKYVDAL